MGPRDRRRRRGVRSVQGGKPLTEGTDERETVPGLPRSGESSLRILDWLSAFRKAARVPLRGQEDKTYFEKQGVRLTESF